MAPLARKPSLITIAIHGHSRSFILQSITSRQRIAYRHAVLISKVSEEVAT